MISPSNPDWLSELIAEEGDSRPIGAHEQQVLLSALVAAQTPKPIFTDRHRQILAQALGLSFDDDPVDPLAPATAEEQSAATKLRDSLDADSLILSLRLAHQPPPLPGTAELSLRGPALLNQSHRAAWRRRGWPRTAWGAFAAAAAASLWFFARSNGMLDGFQAAHPESDTLALSRSTKTLFEKPFVLSATSERIDKIALVRSRELRNNRFAIWGLP